MTHDKIRRRLQQPQSAAPGRAAIPSVVVEGSRPDPTLLCAGCGDVIGVYEPAWVEAGDSSLHPSSALNLNRESAKARKRDRCDCL